MHRLFSMNKKEHVCLKIKRNNVLIVEIDSILFKEMIGMCN